MMLDPKLDAVLAHLAGQPGAAADVALQLRRALTQDETLLRRYNRLVAEGHLASFAVSRGSDPNLVGTYDKAGAVITLPSTESLPTATEFHVALTSVLRIQELSVRYAHSSWTNKDGAQQPVTQNMVANLQATLNGAPALAEQLRRAVTSSGPGQDAPVRAFDSLPGGFSAGGTYTPGTGTINLPAALLNQPTLQFQRNTLSVTDLTMVLGHEVQHGVNAVSKEAARREFMECLTAVAQRGGPDFDYTTAIEGYQQAARQDEAKASIAAWNALLSREQRANPGAGLAEMMDLANPLTRNGTPRIHDFIKLDPASQQGMPKAGLSFNPDGSLDMTPTNIEHMARHYFHKPPEATRIGHHGDSDYPNYYGADAVTAVIFAHRHYAVQPDGSVPPLRIDMARLGLREDLLERNGIEFPRGTPVPVGAADDVRQPYLDTSHAPHLPGHFDYTRTPAHTPNQHRHVPVAAAGAGERGTHPDTGRARDVPPARALFPIADLPAYLDRMLAVAQVGDDATFREMTRGLAGQPSGQALRAQAAETVDRQDMQALREAAQPGVPRQHEAPVLQMER